MKADMLMIVRNRRTGRNSLTECELSVHKFEETDWSKVAITFEEREMMKRSTEISSNSVCYPNFQNKEFLRLSRSVVPSTELCKFQKITHFEIGNQG
jgi:hypothetical protein